MGQYAIYVFGPGVDEPLKIKRGATLAAYHSEGLGSIEVISDAQTGADLATYEYDAFGVLVNSTGSFENSYTYTGRERDASGLYYYRNRYYLSEIGRFLSPDPAGLAGGTNAYAYVNSNPVNFVDPFGLFQLGTPPDPISCRDCLAVSAQTGPIKLAQVEDILDRMGVANRDGSIPSMEELKGEKIESLQRQISTARKAAAASRALALTAAITGALSKDPTSIIAASAAERQFIQRAEEFDRKVAGLEEQLANELARHY